MASKLTGSGGFASFVSFASSGTISISLTRTKKDRIKRPRRAEKAAKQHRSKKPAGAAT
jgi:hypothetical protein